MEFREAAEIARQNPGAILTRDSSGSFIVRLEDGSVIGTTNKVDLAARENSVWAEVTELKGLLAEKDSLIGKLQAEMKSLRDDIESVISTRLESEKSILKKVREEVSLEKSLLAEKTNDVQANLRKLEFLEKAYREHFGDVEIKTIKESVQSMIICPRCGGDGGIRGGCQKCDGSGWVTSTETHYRDVVEFK